MTLVVQNNSRNDKFCYTMYTTRFVCFLLTNILQAKGFSQSADSVKQRDLVDISFGPKREEQLNKQRCERKVYFSILPASVSPAGFGLRLKFNKYSDANLALDLGFSENFWSAWVNL